MKDKLFEGFKNPAAEYRMAPFWSWNGDMDGKETVRQMVDMKEHGFGGAFAHPRQGMITPYLQDSFFEAWKETLKGAKENDMKLYIYDEFTWSSGFAGGIMYHMDKSIRGTILKYRIIDPEKPEFGGELVYAAEFDEENDNRLGRDLTAVPREEWKNVTKMKVIIFYLWVFDNGFTTYPDVTNPRTTELFLQTTYDEYADRFGSDFGDAVPAVFSDEANVISDGRNTIPFGKHIQEKFRQMHGYDILPNAPAVFRNFTGKTFSKPCEKIRYDFYTTIHELWIDNFVKPIASWCDEHNIAWTGHDIEHQWPQSHCGRMLPSEQTTYEFRQWPGLDLLLCEDLRDTPTNHEIFQMYEIRSAANQFGKKRTLCEAYGAGGYHSTVEDYKRLGDFLLVGGINLLVPHLMLYSYTGLRKRDCPQSFDYRQPWWDEFTEIADYLGRGSYILSQGKMNQRILLMNPSTSSYTIPGEEQKGSVDHLTEIDGIKNPDMTDFLTVMNILADNQWDFDIGDEYSMSRHGKVCGKKLGFGLQKYDVVIVSANMTNMKKETVSLLEEFALSGGTLLSTDGSEMSLAKYIDGETDSPLTERIRKCAQKVETDKLNERLTGILEPVMTSEEGFRVGLKTLVREYDDGRKAVFMVNHAMNRYDDRITLRADSICEWDLFTGEKKGVEHTSDGGFASFDISLERCEGRLFILGDGDLKPEEKPACTENVPLKTLSIKAEEENTFSLDHCSLIIDGETTEERYFIETTDNLFMRRCGESNIWRGIQYKDNYLKLDKTFGKDSGFKAVYKFTAEKIPYSLKAVIERPYLYSVYVNGNSAESEGPDRIDPDTGLFDISPFVREGENEIVLEAEKFSVFCELETIFLRGDFSVREDGKKFYLSGKEDISYGTWDKFGYTFYPYGVNYSYEAVLDRVPVCAEIKIEKTEATAVSVTVNGTYAGVVGRNGGYKSDISKFLKEGKNEIVLRLIGSYRNLLGPHLGYRDVEPYAWDYFERGRRAVPSDYEFSHYGFEKEPVLTVSAE